MKEPPAEQEIAHKERVKEKEATLFGSESAEAYTSALSTVQEWQKIRSFGGVSLGSALSLRK